MEQGRSGAERAYLKLRDMAANFVFRPEERLNEGVLSRELGVSRTPLREALNRLAAEGFLVAHSGRGFFCRPLSPSRIVDLYEARLAVECEAVRRGCQRAPDHDIAELTGWLDASAGRYDDGADLAQLLEIDEAFHIKLVALSGNEELINMLRNINARIRYVRLVNFRKMRQAGADGMREGVAAHRAIADAVARRSEEEAVTALRRHIERRREETTELVRIAFSELYVAM